MCASAPRTTALTISDNATALSAAPTNCISRNRSPSSASACSASSLVGTSGTECIFGRPTSNSRSEEHTSELQSLMRLSYAVFCLKKNNRSSIHSPPTLVLIKQKHPSQHTCIKRTHDTHYTLK